MWYKTVFAVLWFSMCSLVALRTGTYAKVGKILSRRPGREALLLGLALLGMGAVPLTYLVTDWLVPFSFSAPLWVRVSGAVTYGIGFLLLFWVHLTLGCNWSPFLEISKGHVLVTGGPYRWVRHPLYLAFYVMAVGQWLLTANWFVGFLGVLLWSVFYLARVGHEEKMMLDFFGREYKEYMERTGRLLPKIRRIL